MGVRTCLLRLRTGLSHALLVCSGGVGPQRPRPFGVPGFDSGGQLAALVSAGCPRQGRFPRGFGVRGPPGGECAVVSDPPFHWARGEAGALAAPLAVSGLCRRHLAVEIFNSSVLPFSFFLFVSALYFSG